MVNLEKKKYVRPHLSRARSDSVCVSDEMPESEDGDESNHKSAEEDEVIWKCFEN